MWDGDGGRDDLRGRGAGDDGSFGWAGSLSAGDDDGGLEDDGGDWCGVRRWGGGGSQSEGVDSGHDGWVLWNVSSADTLEVLLGRVDLVIGGSVGGETLVDVVDEVVGRAEAVDVGVGLAAGGEQPGVQALGEDGWAVGGWGWGRWGGLDGGWLDWRRSCNG